MEDKDVYFSVVHDKMMHSVEETAGKNWRGENTEKKSRISRQQSVYSTVQSTVHCDL
jgi:hypothetical protein